MPRFNHADYADLANSILAKTSADATLSDAFRKTAKDRGMNAHEAQRLLESTNVLAHLDQFEKRSSKADRYVEFTPLDPADELPALFGAEKKRPTAKTASMLSPHDEASVAYRAVDAAAPLMLLDLPNEHFEKTASLPEFEGDLSLGLDPVPSALAIDQGEHDGSSWMDHGNRSWHAYQLVEKVAEGVADRAFAARYAFAEKLAALSRTLDRVDSLPFDHFERDCRQLFGSDADVPLQILKEAQPDERAQQRVTKTAEARGLRWSPYVQERHEHRQMRDVVAALKDVRDWEAARANLVGA